MILPTQGLTLSYESAVSVVWFLPLVAGVDSSMDRNHGEVLKVTQQSLRMRVSASWLRCKLY